MLIDLTKTYPDFITARECRSKITYNEQTLDNFYAYLSDLIKNAAENNYTTIYIRSFGSLKDKVDGNDIRISKENYEIFVREYDKIVHLLESKGFTVTKSYDTSPNKTLFITW